MLGGFAHHAKMRQIAEAAGALGDRRRTAAQAIH
jgi:hypothetical protein